MSVSPLWNDEHQVLDMEDFGVGRVIVTAHTQP